jgi:hypothetical protein
VDALEQRSVGLAPIAARLPGMREEMELMYERAGEVGLWNTMQHHATPCNSCNTMQHLQHHADVRARGGGVLVESVEGVESVGVGERAL